MKITVKQSNSNQSARFDKQLFEKKAQAIFLKEVKPQLDLAKSKTMPKNSLNCNNHI